MSDNEIRASEAQIRANAHESTLRSLKELLLLAEIADAEKIEVGEEDAALEIEAMAARTDESVRRVRARVEKEGGPDSLATQILERKVIDRILEDVRSRSTRTVRDLKIRPPRRGSIGNRNRTTPSQRGRVGPRP